MSVKLAARLTLGSNPGGAIVSSRLQDFIQSNSSYRVVCGLLEFPWVCLSATLFKVPFAGDVMETGLGVVPPL